MNKKRERDIKGEAKKEKKKILRKQAEIFHSARIQLSVALVGFPYFSLKYFEELSFRKSYST